MARSPRPQERPSTYCWRRTSQTRRPSWAKFEWDNKSWLRTTDDDDFYLSITDEKVKQAFAEFKPYKAAGEDGIPPIALQNLTDSIITRVRRTYQSIIQTHYTPKSWRRMKVIFIPKPGKDDYSYPKAVRPITLSSFLFKGLEKILQWHLGTSNDPSDTLVQPVRVHTRMQHGARHLSNCRQGGKPDTTRQVCTVRRPRH